jgi:hypothetical protein
MTLTCPLAKAVIEWLHRPGKPSSSKGEAEPLLDEADATASLKSPILNAIATQYNAATNNILQDQGIAFFATHLLLPCCRVASADHRELWEILDVPDRAAASVVKGPVNLWNEQQAFKKAVGCLTSLLTDSAGEGMTVANEHQQLLLNWVLDEMSVALKPIVAGSTKPYIIAEAEAQVLQHQIIADSPNVYILPMAYIADGESTKKLAASSQATTSHNDNVDSCEESSSNVNEADSAAALSVVAEGSLHCAQPVPPFSRLLAVPRTSMFTRSVLGGRCALYDACAAVQGAWEAFPDDETVLLMCFVFEQFFVGATHSAWRDLLLGCPLCYPSVPTFWTFAELGELEGTTMIDDVLEKKAALTQFHGQLVNAMSSMPKIGQLILERCFKKTSSGHIAAENNDDDSRQQLTAALLESHPTKWFELLFSEDHLHWARATFDSRAFNLNIDGNVTIALVPFADMINHGTRSDVIKRHVEPNGGPFVLTTGAALLSEDVGRELMMSYGPLQSWELIMSYGFILNDSEVNDNDRIPLPLSVDESVNEDDGPVEREYKSRRSNLMKQHGLLIGGASLWVGHQGIPCAALLAILRLQLAEIEHYPLLEASPFSVFDAVDAALEQRVVLTLQNIVDVMLQDYSTTIEEDEALLNPSSSEGEVDEGEEDDDNDDDNETVTGNTKLAVQLRLRMKRMLHAAAEWCRDALGALSQH